MFLFRIIPFIALGLFATSASASFEFTPMMATLLPSGTDSSTSFVVQNTSDAKIPVQISIVRREPDAEGNEEFKESPEIDDLFQIFPSQLVLNPKERRTVRVSWIGDPKLTTEHAFRIIAEELPFKLDEPKQTYTKPMANISISVRYVGSLYVAPSNAQPVLTGTIEPLKDKGGKRLLIIENKGSRHKLLQGLKVTVTPPGGNPIEVPKDSLKSAEGENILSKKQRKFVIPWPGSLPPVTALKVDVSASGN